MLYKCWIEDFNAFCSKVGGTTREVMGRFLSFEADRRAIAIASNSVGTELTHDDKKSLFCKFGSLYPYGQKDLAQAEDHDEILKVLSDYSPYNRLLALVRMWEHTQNFFFFFKRHSLTNETLPNQCYRNRQVQMMIS